MISKGGFCRKWVLVWIILEAYNLLESMFFTKVCLEGKLHSVFDKYIYQVSTKVVKTRKQQCWTWCLFLIPSLPSCNQYGREDGKSETDFGRIICP